MSIAGCPYETQPLCEENKQLRAENEKLKAELAEQARIVGMGAERELALLAKAERLEKELAEQGERIAELKKECERFRQEALDSYLDDEESVITKQALEITRLKVELAEAKKDAEKWREREAKIKSLKERGFLRSPLRDEPYKVDMKGK